MSNHALFLYGTDELLVPPQSLSAGPLTALLSRDGGLRSIRFHGVEILRAVSFLVRTEGWGTPDPSLSNLHVESNAEHSRVSYDAKVRDRDAILHYRINIELTAAGRLEARASIRPQTDFTTNRTGFVVLHPLEGVAGQPVKILHVDGHEEQTVLPAEISPGQPLRDIRAITSYPALGLAVTTRLEGDTFEMEDQRNWSDASFKTYNRPLTLPFPYLLKAGSTLHQSVTLTVSGQPVGGFLSAKSSTNPLTVQIGQQSATVLPRIGIAVAAELAHASVGVSGILRDAAPNIFLAHFDPTRGHGLAELRAIRQLAEASDVPVTLEIIVPGVDDPLVELKGIAEQIAQAGLRPTAVAVFPKVDEKSFQPGEPRPPTPELADIYAAARATFPGLRLGGGTPAFFTELNRKHPPSERLDYVSHGTCPIVHAADDASVMQTLETLPWIVRSAQRIAGPTDYQIGPVALGARQNPYGDAPSANPHNGRVGLAEVDPRQRGLFGAAWYLGYAATVAPLGILELVLSASVGPFGIVHIPQPFVQPWYDGLAAPAVYPVFHVISELARAAGSPLITTRVSDPSRLAALAWSEGDHPRLALANLSAERQLVQLEGWAEAPVRGRILDADSFKRATLDWLEFRKESQPLDDHGELALPPYSIALIGGVE
jgi:D-apionolactonase